MGDNIRLLEHSKELYDDDSKVKEPSKRVKEFKGDRDIKMNRDIYGRYDMLHRYFYDTVKQERREYKTTHMQYRNYAKRTFFAICICFVFFLVYMNPSMKNKNIQKKDINFYFRTINPEIEKINNMMKVLNSSTDMENFIEEVSKPHTLSSPVVIAIYRYSIRNIPESDAVKDLIDALDKHLSNIDINNLSSETIHKSMAGIQFTCEKLVKSKLLRQEDCENITDWDNIKFMKSYGIYLVEEIIPEFQKGSEFFYTTTQKLWKYHQLDESAKYYDNFLLNPYWYAMITLIKTQYPVFYMVYEIISLMKLAPITAQEMILETDASVYYHVTTNSLGLYIFSLFIGYGVIYLPILVILCMLNYIYAPMSLPHILFQKLLTTVETAIYSLTFIENNTPKNRTSTPISRVMFFAYLVYYMKRTIGSIICLFIVSNLLSILVSFIIYDQYNIMNQDIISIWSYEIVKICSNMIHHFKYSTSILVVITFYSFSMIFLRFILYTILSSIKKQQISPHISLCGESEQNGSIIVEILSVFIIFLANFTYWIYQSRQIIDVMWNQLVQSVIPISHLGLQNI